MLTTDQSEQTAQSECRWDLYCTKPATGVIHHTRIGDIPGCDEHQAEYDANTDPNDQVGYREAQPSCWCPDSHRDNGLAVPYCPAHGTPEKRGLDLA